MSANGNRGRKILLGMMTACLLFIVLLFAYMFAPKTRDVVFVPIPPDSVLVRAEFWPKASVQPGTFKFIVPLERFLEEAERTDARPIVSYSLGFAGELELKLWLPRGNGTFLYAETGYPAHSWGIPFHKTVSVSLAGDAFILTMGKEWIEVVVATLLLAALAALFFVLAKILTPGTAARKTT